MNNCQVLAWQGLIALRQGEQETARQAFSAASDCADALLATNPHNHRILSAKGLAHSGLGLVFGEAAGQPDFHTAAAAYRAARQINRDPGMIRRSLLPLEALAQVHPQGTELLAEVLTAAVGDGET
jgi:hypothetical protein